MGYDLLFYKMSGGDLNFDESDVPEDFSHRYEGRQQWLSLMWDLPHDSKQTCNCDLSVDGKHHYFCADPSATRPKDFAAFRRKIRDAGLDSPDWGDGRAIFSEMTDWLEAHPEIYVSFSN